MKADHSILVYSPTFRPLDHWERVLPGVRMVQVSDPEVPVPTSALMWVSSDVPEWQSLVRTLSEKGAKVAILTRTPEPEEMNRGLACGARAYLPALSNGLVFQQVAETVRAGGLWFPETLLAGLLQTVASAMEHRQNRRPSVNLDVLSAREREVAERAAKGASNRSIATDLGITERTVKEHMGSIFKKLAVRDRMQLMLHVSGQLASGEDDDVHQA